MSRQPATESLKPRLIRASAGTGKTYELSSRYIALLAAGERPEHILATTFTRKAAGEIQSRIFSRLAAAALDARQAAELGKSTGFEITSSRALDLLSGLVASQHRLNISTLDALFVRMVRSFSLDLGLPAQWQICDEHQYAELLEETATEVCAAADRKGFSTLMQLTGEGGFRRSVHAQIVRVVRAMHSIFRSTQPEAWRWLTAPAGVSPETLSRFIKELPELAVPTNRDGKVDAVCKKDYAKAALRASRGEWAELIGAGVAKALLEGKEVYNRKVIPEEVAAIYMGLIAQARSVLLGRLSQRIESSYSLLESMDSSLGLQQNRRALYTFEDLKFLLADLSLSEQADEIYYRLDSRIKHLLLDEFQDTSVPQWQVLEPLADEILAQEAGSHSFFCVGDLKQAIYGWRGGVAEIFGYLEERYKTQTEVESREKSRRCSKSVIDTVNKVFSGLSGNAALDKWPTAAKDWQGFFRKHETFSESQGYVELRRISSEPDESGQKFSQERIAALTVRNILDAAPGCTIGVLARSNRSVVQMLREFSAEDVAVQASQEGGAPLTDSAAVEVLLAALILADHPEDSIARFHLAVSPLGEALGFTDHRDRAGARALASRVRAGLCQQGYGCTLAAWADALRFRAGPRDRRRLQQLVELAQSYDEKRGLRADRFVRLVRETKLSDPLTSNVRVMTVHASKGLEFDAVLLLDLESDPARQGPGDVLLWRENPLSEAERVSVNVSQEVASLCPELQEMQAGMAGQKLKEELGVLYVAMTRAKHALYMLTQGTPGRHTMGRVLEVALCLADSDAEALYQAGRENWYEDLPSRAARLPVRSSSGQIQLAPLPVLPRRGIARHSPSELEGGDAIDLKQVLNAAGRESRERGKKLHALFEKVEWVEDFKLDEVRAASADAQLFAEFQKILESSEIASALSRERYPQFDGCELQVQLEQRFALLTGAELLNGCFDRLVLIKKDARVIAAEILDYKTDRLSAGDAAGLAERVERYRPQIEAYRKVVMQTYGLSSDAVSAALVFVTSGSVMAL